VPIASFGAIQHKLAEMAIRIFASDSALYRTAKWIDDKEMELREKGKHDNETLLGAAEEYAIECAMLKVLGSECLDYVVDEGVQIHGGNGYSDEYDISRSYRDSRINRIFEGTNEINRLLTVDMYLKRALKGRMPDFGSDDAPFAAEQKAISNFKKAALLCAGASAQKLMAKLENEQEILMNIADMVIDTFEAESMLLRAIKMKNNNHENADLALDATRTYIFDAADRIDHAGKECINAFADGDEQRMMLMGLKRFTKTDNFNTKNARRRICARLLDKGDYFF
jgi:alkylation response protein AidB-like acyl-CoA dehydrogenase